MNLRQRLSPIFFQHMVDGQRRLRAWALFVVTSLLAIFWKLLLELDKLFSKEFWLAVFGPTPLEDLGPNGLILLAFYAVGAVIWWMVTSVLLWAGRQWVQRVGLS
ncbi:hypothetical protein [Vitreimonas sp.]|jgi:hypothetical protein|uniref:hypothetical protein n=1 Tax=Vitreimonas sp. TaxID=3069702 RepID=UPI002ED8970C